MALSEELERYIRTIPKAELHVHVEGTLEPELMFKIAERNGVPIEGTVQSHKERRANFKDLQDFLDLYYGACSVLKTEQDFYDLMFSYLQRAAADNVYYAEIFFDPQTHIQNGIAFETVFTGLYRATVDAQIKLGIKGRIIISFLRHLSEEDALQTLERAAPFLSRIIAMDLDSGELGNPPKKFSSLFKRAAELGLKLTTHAGEEGGPDYVEDALAQKVVRINHGVRSLENPELVKKLAKEKVPLTVCPLSNKKLQVFNRFFNGRNVIKDMLEKGLMISINSDDPAYFGGYINDNYLVTAKEVGLTHTDVYQICQNAFNATFLAPQDKEEYLYLLEQHKSKPSAFVSLSKRATTLGSHSTQPVISMEYTFGNEVSKLLASKGYTVTSEANGIIKVVLSEVTNDNGETRKARDSQEGQHADDCIAKSVGTHNTLEHAQSHEIFVVCPAATGMLAKLMMSLNLSLLKLLGRAATPLILLPRDPWEQVISHLKSNMQLCDEDVELLKFVDSPHQVLERITETQLPSVLN